MKKRVLSILLCLCMVLSCIPAQAFAVAENEEGTEPVQGNDIENTGLDLSGGIPKEETAYKAGSGQIIVKPSADGKSVTLTLDRPEFAFYRFDGPVIHLKGVNVHIVQNGYVEIRGLILVEDGTLDVTLDSENEFNAILAEKNDGVCKTTVYGDADVVSKPDEAWFTLSETNLIKILPNSTLKYGSASTLHSTLENLQYLDVQGTVQIDGKLILDSDNLELTKEQLAPYLEAIPITGAGFVQLRKGQTLSTNCYDFSGNLMKDITSSSLELDANDPSGMPTCTTNYKSGNGRVVFTPPKDGKPANLLLLSSDPRKGSIHLKNMDVTVEIGGYWSHYANHSSILIENGDVEISHKGGSFAGRIVQRQNGIEWSHCFEWDIVSDISVDSEHRMIIYPNYEVEICDNNNTKGVLSIASSDFIENEGSILNNGLIMLQHDETKSDVEAIESLKLNPGGAGRVQVIYQDGSMKIYKNNGEFIENKRIDINEIGLDFSTQVPDETRNYVAGEGEVTFEPASSEGQPAHLRLDKATVSKTINLGDLNLDIHLTGDNYVNQISTSRELKIIFEEGASFRGNIIQSTETGKKISVYGTRFEQREDTHVYSSYRLNLEANAVYAVEQGCTLFVDEPSALTIDQEASITNDGTVVLTVENTGDAAAVKEAILGMRLNNESTGTVKVQDQSGNMSDVIYDRNGNPSLPDLSDGFDFTQEGLPEKETTYRAGQGTITVTPANSAENPVKITLENATVLGTLNLNGISVEMHVAGTNRLTGFIAEKLNVIFEPDATLKGILIEVTDQVCKTSLYCLDQTLSQDIHLNDENQLYLVKGSSLEIVDDAVLYVDDPAGFSKDETSHLTNNGGVFLTVEDIHDEQIIKDAICKLKLDPDGSGWVRVRNQKGEIGDSTYNCAGDLYLENITHGYDFTTTGLPTEKTFFRAGKGVITFIPADDRNPAKLILDHAEVYGLLAFNAMLSEMTVEIIGDNCVSSLVTGANLNLTGSGNLTTRYSLVGDLTGVKDHVKGIVGFIKYDPDSETPTVCHTVLGEGLLNSQLLEEADMESFEIGIQSRYAPYQELEIPENASLTLDSSLYPNALQIYDIKAVHNSGILCNNATNALTLVYSDSISEEQIKKDIQSLKLTGDGTVCVISQSDSGNQIQNSYSNQGIMLRDLFLENNGQSQGDLEKDGYHWDPNKSVLELKDFQFGNLVLTTEKLVTIHIEGKNSGSALLGDKFVFEGGGTLSLQGLVGVMSAQMISYLEVKEDTVVSISDFASMFVTDLRVFGTLNYRYSDLMRQVLGEPVLPFMPLNAQIGSSGTVCLTGGAIFVMGYLMNEGLVEDADFVIQEGGKLCSMMGFVAADLFKQDPNEILQKITIPESYIPEDGKIDMKVLPIDSEIVVCVIGPKELSAEECLEKPVMLGYGAYADNDGIFQHGSTEFRFAFDLPDADAVLDDCLVDGKSILNLDNGTYTYDPESNSIVFSNDYLNSLQAGTHTFTAVYVGGQGSTEFTVKHELGKDWKSDAASHWHECPCGQVSEMADHTYGTWTKVKAPTETEKGLLERTCTVCGHKETTEIPVLHPTHKDDRIETHELTQVPESLKNTPYNTVEKIVMKLQNTASSGLNGLTDGNIQYQILDVVLMITENGVTRPATEAEIRERGSITVNIPYPEGTNKTDFLFSVTHMLTVAMNGMQPGDVENPDILLTDKGIQVSLCGLSPVVISYAKKAVETPAEKPSTPSAGTPETGDLFAPVLLLNVLAVSGAAALVLLKKRKICR